MWSSVDKALVALVMSVVFLLNYFLGISLGWLTQDTVAAVVAALTPLLVYLVPNKKPA